SETLAGEDVVVALEEAVVLADERHDHRELRWREAGNEELVERPVCVALERADEVARQPLDLGRHVFDVGVAPAVAALVADRTAPLRELAAERIAAPQQLV